MSNTTPIGRQELALPSVAVSAVGAGAGSIATVRNGALTVGPESAGARPGPVCYGRGGERPTVADADVVLGYLNTELLGGKIHLDVEAARRAIQEHIAEPLGLSVEEAAEGIKTIVDARMADLVRQVTIQQGYDPADFSLFAYGGAGPSHAFSYGAELGCRQIVIPITASVHSAFGIGCSDLTMVEEQSKPLQSVPGDANFARSLDPAEFNTTFDALIQKAERNLVAAGAQRDSITYSKSVEIRFRSQIHVVSVGIDADHITEDDVNTLVHRFIDTYEARFGKGAAFPEAGVEITTFRLAAHSPVRRREVDLTGTEKAVGDVTARQRPVFSNGAWVEATVLDGDQLRDGLTLTGLTIVELRDTTVVIGPDQVGTVDPFGNLIITAA